MKQQQDLLDLAYDLGVSIINAKSKADRSRVAVHRLNPSLAELKDAIDSADKGQFSLIIIHTEATWPGNVNGKSVSSFNKNVIYVDFKNRKRL